jgi:hypothetical protein
MYCSYFKALDVTVGCRIVQLGYYLRWSPILKEISRGPVRLHAYLRKGKEGGTREEGETRLSRKDRYCRACPKEASFQNNVSKGRLHITA